MPRNARHTAELIEELFLNPEGQRANDNARLVQIDHIKPASVQPREVFDSKDLKHLADSIREHGILQPILVRYQDDTFSTFEIVAGERRYRAAQSIGLKEVPVTIADVNDDTRWELALVENITRADLNQWEECQAVAELQRRTKYSVSELMAKLGKDRGWVNNRRAGAKAGADPKLRELLEEFPDTLSHVLLIDKIENPNLRRQLINRTREGASVPQLRAIVEMQQPRPEANGSQPLPPPAPVPVQTQQGTVPLRDYAPTRSFDLSRAEKASTGPFAALAGLMKSALFELAMTGSITQETLQAVAEEATVQAGGVAQSTVAA